MSNVTIYHNPRCSKSRASLELLQQRGVEPKIVEYLKSPPTEQELDRILRLLDMEPRQLIRSKEKVYAEAGLDDQSLSRAEIIARMVANPAVIERPIVVKEDKAAVGRPPENILEIL